MRAITRVEGREEERSEASSSLGWVSLLSEGAAACLWQARCITGGHEPPDARAARGAAQPTRGRRRAALGAVGANVVTPSGGEREGSRPRIVEFVAKFGPRTFVGKSWTDCQFRKSNRTTTALSKESRAGLKPLLVFFTLPLLCV